MDNYCLKKNQYANDNGSLNVKTILTTLDTYGFVVLEEYYTKQQANKWRHSIVSWLKRIIPNLEDSEWTSFNTPYGPRFGMFQSIIGHCPTIWEIREDSYNIFRQLLSCDKLLTSIDGATVCPITTRKVKDWPHIDQTRDDIKCIQGQVVLTDTTACFRCTPFSNHKHKEIIQLCNKEGDKTNWLKFSDRQTNDIKKLFPPEQWQIPIYSKKGSVILWRSTLIHSSQRHVKNIENDDWRCVVYVCMRPESEFTKRNKTTLRNAALNGRMTNHWGTKTFPKNVGGGAFTTKKCETVMKLSHDLKQLVIEKYSPLLKKLTAQEEW